MNIYRSINEVPYEKNSILTIGTFDGIHLGHRKVIGDLIRTARQKKIRSVLVTFYPYPQTIVRTLKSPIELLTPLDEKIRLLKELGLDILLVIPFTQELSHTEPDIFVESVLVNSVGVCDFIIGYNHAFGKGRRGGAELLKELGSRFDFSVNVTQPVEIDGGGVSSTRIRHLLLQGDVRGGNRLLGRYYSLEGLVKKGNNLGNKIGFPTANIDVFCEKKLIPRDGVYAVVVHFNVEGLPGMANIGYKPTMDGKNRGIEVHIHNFSGDLYNKKLKVEFIDRIRDEKQFDSVEKLVSQIELDRKMSIELLSKSLKCGNVKYIR